MAAASDITVCVPMHNAASTIGETLTSITAQTLPPARILAFDDASTDDTLEVAGRYATQAPLEVVAHHTRRGWVANVNALIRAVETPYFCITPHDDVLHADYLRVLREVAGRDGSVACVYSDLQGFGSRSQHLVQPDLRGDQFARAMGMLLHHESAVAFRGLVRRGTDHPPLLCDANDGYQADTVWLMTLALRGELRRVPRTLYYKRYAPTTVHAEWRRRSHDELLVLRAQVASRCAAIAHGAFDSADERALLTCAALLRTLGIGRAGGQGIPQGESDVVEALLTFVHAMKVPLPSSMRVLLKHERAAPLRDALAERRHNGRPDWIVRAVKRLLS